MAEAVRQKRKLGTYLLATLILAVFCGLMALGTWQMQRLAWKENLLAELDKNLASDPVPISVIMDALQKGVEFEYRPVKVTGRFDHENERHFFATHEGRVGYYVYTPLSFDEGVIFINRGFVPFDFKDPATRLDGQIKGLVTIRGLARKMLDDKPSGLVPDNDAEKNIYYWKDLRLMAAQSGIDFNSDRLLKFFVDADKRVDQESAYPMGGVTLIDLPNNHLQYAYTWYGLAMTLVLIVLYYRFRRTRDLDKSGR